MALFTFIATIALGGFFGGFLGVIGVVIVWVLLAIGGSRQDDRRNNWRQ